MWQVAAGGYLYLQTPDAHHLDLARTASVRQVLQQPYHRHLVTAAWLAERLGRLGFEPVARTHRPYFHTRIPFLNLPTIDWYLDRHGGLVALKRAVPLVVAAAAGLLVPGARRRARLPDRRGPAHLPPPL